MKIEFFQTMNYHGPVNVDSWPAPPRACDSEWTKVTYRALARRVRRRARRRLRLVELRRAPLLTEAADTQPDDPRCARRPAVPGRADRRVRHRSAAEQPGADRRGVLDARQPPRRPAPHRDAARHAQRVPHLRLEPVGVARALRGRHAARAGLLHRARTVRVGRSLLPLPQHRGVAAPRAGSAPAHPHLGQQPRTVRSSPASTASTSASRTWRPRSARFTPTSTERRHGRHGWEPTADNIQYRHFMYVAPTDADVAEARPAFEGKGLMSIFAGATPDTMLTMMQIGAALGGVPKHVKIEPGMAPRLVPAPAFYGSPDTVNAQIAEAARVLGHGAARDLGRRGHPDRPRHDGVDPEADRRRGRPRRSWGGMVSDMVSDMAGDRVSDNDTASVGAAFGRQTVAAAGFDVTLLRGRRGRAVALSARCRWAAHADRPRPAGARLPGDRARASGVGYAAERRRRLRRARRAGGVDRHRDRARHAST